jgi:DNA-binding PucR family transcriptional regulator
MTVVDRAELLRTQVAYFAKDPEWVRQVAVAITDAVHTELPIDADLRSRSQDTAASVVHLFALMIERDESVGHPRPTYEAIEYVREFVIRGVSLDSMIRAYQIGQATFFEWWVHSLRDRIEDPALLSEVIEEGAIWVFRFVQGLTGDLVARYAEERERWVRNAASVRTETVRALLAGEDLDLMKASLRLGYELDREHRAFVVWTEVADHDSHQLGGLERRASELALTMTSGAVLLVPLGGQLVAGWIAGQAAKLPAVTVEPPALAAFGEPGSGVTGFCRSHRQAINARRVVQLSGSRPGTVTRFFDVAVMALASVDERAAREFVRTELGELANDDDETRRLTATFRAYLEEHASPRRTARRLGIHENTVKYRIRAIEELLGRPADERVAESLMAIRLARLVGSAQAGP